jgi:NADPH-dependent glutamate synthase beta subunit-like oxidoreductase
VGTCRRQGAAHITQIELLPKPPEQRDVRNPWPLWPNILRTSSSQEEGCERLWGIQTTSFSGHGNVNSVHGIKLEWKGEKCQPVPGSGFTLQADLVLLATGYLHIEHGPLIEHLGVKLTARGDIAVDEHAMTSVPAVFAAGDSVLGASLVVRAIQQGREAAAGVERYLRG